jgi:hypothetical protein
MAIVRRLHQLMMVQLFWKISAKVAGLDFMTIASSVVREIAIEAMGSNKAIERPAGAGHDCTNAKGTSMICPIGTVFIPSKERVFRRFSSIRLENNGESLLRISWNCWWSKRIECADFDGLCIEVWSVLNEITNSK